MTPSCKLPIFQPVFPSFYMESLRAEGGRCASSPVDHRNLEMLVSGPLIESERPSVFYFSLKIF